MPPPDTDRLWPQTALVLEGGGLRGVYTSGVLYHFMQQKLRFDYVIGVSMGACNAANYIADQPERNRIVNIRFVHDRRYLNYARLLRTGELFGMDFIFDTIPNRLVPFDYDTFFRNPQRCVLAVTDCITGAAVYYDKGELGGDYLKILQASCSLPFVNHPVRYNGRIFMDGGLADSIPLARSIQDGNRKHVLVLTQPRGYRKRPSRLTATLVRLRYPRFKGLQRALNGRAEKYNQTLQWIESLEEDGRIFVVRPKAALTVGRVERDQDKLYATYDQGLADARESHEALWAYLTSPPPVWKGASP